MQLLYAPIQAALFLLWLLGGVFAIGLTAAIICGVIVVCALFINTKILGISDAKVSDRETILTMLVLGIGFALVITYLIHYKYLDIHDIAKPIYGLFYKA